MLKLLEFFSKRLQENNNTKYTFKMCVRQNFALKDAEQVKFLTCHFTTGGLLSALKISL